MKKSLTFLLTAVAVLAIASMAGAVTCTLDQHPAATLLVPYFQAAINDDGSIPSGSAYNDTTVTIGNASAVPVLAHVSVYNRRSVVVLDFMVALSGFDIQSWRTVDVLTGVLPVTPSPNVPAPAIPGGIGDSCQRNPAADDVGTLGYCADCYLRFKPTAPANTLDNVSASTQYPVPAFGAGSAFAESIYDALDQDTSLDCGPVPGPFDGVNTGLLTGYYVIDMVNYCTLANPSDSSYWNNDAGGWENPLWGDYILISGTGTPTFGNPTVNVEADANNNLQSGGTPGGMNGFPTTSLSVVRTFYARYWESSLVGNLVDSGSTANGDEDAYLIISPFPNLTPNNTFGDAREPLGVNWAARYVSCGDSASPCGLPITSSYRIWRGGGDFLTDLTGNSCTASEAFPAGVVFDEDENTVITGVCPSPCTTSPFNFPYETQQVDFTAVGSTPGPDGWVALNFLNSGDPNITSFDQAWIGYNFSTTIAFVNAGIEGTQLDATSCAPAGLPTPVILVVPEIP
jgi:hypothetical protein